MNTRANYREALIAGLLLLAFVLTGCQAATTKSNRVESGWSRGEKLGQAALNNQVGIAIHADGNRVALAWVREDAVSDAAKLHLAQVDAAGQAQIDRDINVETTSPEQVQILPDPGGDWRLFWIDGARNARQLFCVQLDAKGEALSLPEPLSLAGASVSSYAVEQGPGGQAEVFWASREGQNMGLYHSRVADDGKASISGQPLSVGGFDPAARSDNEGRLHLIWYEEPEFDEFKIRYAFYDAARDVLSDAVDLALFPTGLGLTAHRPALGITTTDAYVFWSLERRGGGRTEPMAESFWLSFPLAEPTRATKPQYVNVPPANHPEYQMTMEGFSTGQWVPASEETLPSTFVYLPSTIRGQREALPVAFSVQLEGRTQTIMQVVLTLWRDGRMQGYQIAARTGNSSLRPVLAVGGNHLHLTWIDTAGFGKYDVYYASSAPNVRDNLNRVTPADLVAGAMNLAWGAIQALSFVPIALVWAFLPLLVVSLYAFVRAEDDMARSGPRSALIVAILLYIAFKYLFRPNWLASLPLPRGIPQNVAEGLIYVAPFAISIVAGLATWFYVRKRETASLFPTLGVFVGTDVLLTLLLYVPSLLAE